jgi:carbamoylphosphate synthase small subunit
MYFMTAYPTNDPNNGTLAGGLGTAGGSTATILGGVAVAGVAAGGVAYVVKHFRSGGSVKSLIGVVLKNRGQIAKTLKDLPLPDSVKAKMMNAESLIPDSAKDLIKAAKSPQDLINNLPIPEELKSHLKRKAGNINMEEKLMKMLQDASGVEIASGPGTADAVEEEVPTVSAVLEEEKPATTIVVDQGVQLSGETSKKSVNIIVESPTGTSK